MQAILNAFWQIALFREGPESLPDSRPMLILAASLYALTDSLIMLSSNLGGRVLAQSWDDFLFLRQLAGLLIPIALDISLLLVSVAATLFYFGNLDRLRQTLTALFGVSTLLQVISWPCFVLLFFENLSVLWALLILALVLVLLWSIAAYGHILSHAISRSFGVGVALAALFFFLNYQMFKLIPDF